MHLQPLAKTRDQLLAGFIPPPFLSLATEKGVQSVASHIKFGGGEILLDYSLAYANGVFLRLSSIFQGHPTQAEMLARMTADQERVFKILDIQEAGTAS